MENQSPQKILIASVLLSFIAAIIGTVMAEQYLFGNQLMAQKNVQTLAENQPIQKEQVTYVEESESIDAIKKVGPAVVSIVTTKDFKIYKNQPFSFGLDDTFDDDIPGFYFAPRQRQPNMEEGEDYEVKKRKVGGGSGFIITEDGMVLTNRHVVSDKGVEYTIVVSDGTEYDGEVVSIDSLNDLAVLQMVKQGEISKKKEERTKLSGLTVAEMGDSNALQVGQKVLAIGYALGEYQNTVTAGIISAKSREITAANGSRRGAETLSGLLQTDTAINPGNSGGPLINLNGQVVGINVAIDNSGSSIGFAIPMNDVKPVLESIKKYGKIVRPVLGVRHIILNKARAQELKLEVDHGALLVGNEEKGEFAVIPGSPADKAGLKIKDVILSIDGKDITVENGLTDVVAQHKPGDEITVKVWRSGETKEFKVTLGENKEEEKN